MKKGRAVGAAPCALALWMTGMFGANPAYSQEDAKEAARARLHDGAQLLNQGEYASALRVFQQAYDLVPSPKIQFNFGLAYIGLGRHAEALRAFETFVRDASNVAPATLEDAKHQIESLRGRVGTVEVLASSPGLEVTIDGHSHGRTPLAKPVYVDPGPHQLLVERDGVPVIQNFSVQAGSKITLRVSFPGPGDKPPATLPEAALRAGANSPGPAIPPPEPARPLYRRPWVLGIVGGALLAGTITAILLTRRDSYPNGTNGRIEVP